MSSIDRPSARYLTRDPSALMRAFVQQPVIDLPFQEARDLRERTIRELDRYRARFMGRAGFPVKLRRALLLGAAACVPLGILWAAWAFQARPAHAAGIVDVVPLAGSAAVTRDGIDRILATATKTSLDSRDELRTGPEALARASLPTGVVVDIGPSTDVRFDPGGAAEHGPLRDRIELVTGKVQVHVPKLEGGDEVNVLAAGVAVVVHGTEFSVERVMPKPGEAGLTRVVVTQGEVTVYTAEQKQVLTARAVLVLLAPPLPENPIASPAPAPSQPAAQPTGAVRPATQGSAAAGSSTLAAENALLADGMRLRRGHESQRALTRLRELLERYPHSPLAEAAWVERLHALEDLGATTELRREAGRYLADYPAGYARPEASRMFASSSGNRP